MMVNDLHSEVGLPLFFRWVKSVVAERFARL